jgi:hypothetical protein
MNLRSRHWRYLALLLTLALMPGLMAALGTLSALVYGLLAIGGLLATAWLGYRLGHRQPTRLRDLMRIAQTMLSNQVSSEDLRQLEAIAADQDPIGQLAAVLREMARATDEREKSLSSEIAHLQAQMRSDIQRSTGLELAYYEALRKKSSWLRQQLQQQAEGRRQQKAEGKRQKTES